MDTKRSPWLLYPGDVGGEIRPASQIAIIKSIVFSDYIDPEHRCVLKDAKERIVYEQRGATDYSPVTIEFPCTYHTRGLYLIQLDSGKCEVHIR